MKFDLFTAAMTVFVFAFGFAVFAEAGRPMSSDSPAVSAWATAFCERDYDALYDLTYTPEHVERDAFAALAAQYADQNEILPGCYAEVIVHQARNTAVPAALRDHVMAARFFPEVDFHITPTERRVLGITAMMTTSGRWLVYVPFITPTQEYRIPTGETANIIDQDALPIGYAMVRNDAVVLPDNSTADSEYSLIGVPLTLQTLGLPWMTYRVELLENRAVAVPLNYREHLPPEHQAGYLAAHGGGIGQNLTLENFVWFRVADPGAVFTLSVTATVEAWDVSPTTYFAVTVAADESTGGEMGADAFSPFADTQVIDHNASEIIFEITFDTTGMSRQELLLSCESFVLQVDEAWLIPGFCDFKPDPWTLFLAPDERLTVAIWYDTNAVSGDDTHSWRLMYRMIEDYALTVFDLWKAE